MITILKIIESAERRSLADCPERVLRLLLGSAFDRGEAGRVLAAVGGAWQPGLREGVVLEQLIAEARRGRASSRRLEAILDARLEGPAGQHLGASMYELADRWQRERATLRGSALTGFLWAIIRREEPIFRTLEARVAEELEVMALRALAAEPAPEFTP
jgi:hypothetical protein